MCKQFVSSPVPSCVVRPPSDVFDVLDDELNGRFLRGGVCAALLSPKSMQGVTWSTALHMKRLESLGLGTCVVSFVLEFSFYDGPQYVAPYCHAPRTHT